MNDDIQKEEHKEGLYFVHKDLFVDLYNAKVFNQDGKVYVSMLEYQILVQLIHNAGEVVPCQSLLQSIWGKYHEDDPKVVWVQIARLRKKIEQDPKNPVHIITVPRLGYKIPEVNHGKN